MTDPTKSHPDEIRAGMHILATCLGAYVQQLIDATLNGQSTGGLAAECFQTPKLTKFPHRDDGSLQGRLGSAIYTMMDRTFLVQFQFPDSKVLPMFLPAAIHTHREDAVPQLKQALGEGVHSAEILARWLEAYHEQIAQSVLDACREALEDADVDDVDAAIEAVEARSRELLVDALPGLIDPNDATDDDEEDGDGDGDDDNDREQA